MKKFSVVFGAFLTLFLISCEGPVGPPGREGLEGLQGLPGQDGADGKETPLPKIIDIDGTFTPENDYGIRYSFENNIEVIPTDIVLVYLLWEQVDGDDGLPIDIWRPLPQTRLVDQGILQYNFQHTFIDVDVFIETDFDPSLLLPADTDDQVFRIAVLPAESVSGKSSLDKSNISEVMSHLGVSEKDVQRVKL